MRISQHTHTSRVLASSNIQTKTTIRGQCMVVTTHMTHTHTSFMAYYIEIDTCSFAFVCICKWPLLCVSFSHIIRMRTTCVCVCRAFQSISEEFQSNCNGILISLFFCGIETVDSMAFLMSETHLHKPTVAQSLQH